MELEERVRPIALGDRREEGDISLWKLKKKLQRGKWVVYIPVIP